MNKKILRKESKKEEAKTQKEKAIQESDPSTKKPIQWHPAFCAAMQLELKDDEDKLGFEKEHNLSQKPLQIDLLVLKDDAALEVTNEIGKIFRKYNILEYKSPDDEMSIDTYYKMLAYGCLYKTTERKGVDSIKVDEITLTIVRQRYPRELISRLNKMGVGVKECSDGIYRLENPILFPTQIIVTGKLDTSSHIWLKSMMEDIPTETSDAFLKSVKLLKSQHHKDMAKAILSVIVSANNDLKQCLKGAKNMDDVLMELLADKIEEERFNERLKTLFELISKNLLSIENAAKEMNQTADEFKASLEKAGYHL